MILRGPQAEALLRDPPADLAGLLIHGADPDRVNDQRRAAALALAGPAGDEEMRVARMDAAALRADPAAPLDALKAVGFFPGRRVVCVEGVAEPQARPVLSALDGWTPGDAALIVTAPALKKTSKMRRAFEAHKSAFALALYDDPPDGRAVAAMAREAGVALTDDGAREVEALALALEPGEMRQALRALALHADGEAADAAMVRAVAPAALDADADRAVHAAAEGRAAEVVRLMRRLEAQGVNPVTLAILATRHVQQLHGIALGTGQPWGRDRDAMARQARAWGARRLEDALGVLMDADLRLRSASQAPQAAVVERALLRLAGMARAGMGTGAGGR